MGRHIRREGPGVRVQAGGVGAEVQHGLGEVGEGDQVSRVELAEVLIWVVSTQEGLKLVLVLGSNSDGRLTNPGEGIRHGLGHTLARGTT